MDRPRELTSSATARSRAWRSQSAGSSRWSSTRPATPTRAATRAPSRRQSPGCSPESRSAAASSPASTHGSSTCSSQQVDDETAYGYLWWLREYEVAGRRVASFDMSGMGGNRVAVLPELDAVAVVTSENFRVRDAHDRTHRLLADDLLPVAAEARDGGKVKLTE